MYFLLICFILLVVVFRKPLCGGFLSDAVLHGLHEASLVKAPPLIPAVQKVEVFFPRLPEQPVFMHDVGDTVPSALAKIAFEVPDLKKKLPLVVILRVAFIAVKPRLIYRRHAAQIERVTLWGVTDGTSWLNDWPIPGRTNYPLLFDRAGKAKKVVKEIVKMYQPHPLTPLQQPHPLTPLQRRGE